MIFLAQSDTTIGFLGKSSLNLNEVKGRDIKQKVLFEVLNFTELKKHVRVVQKHKNRVRRSRKTTFIYSNQKACRVVGDGLHSRFLEHFGWLYSSSANPSGKGFDLEWAMQKSDVIVSDKRGFLCQSPSKIIKLSKYKIKKIR